MTRKRVPASLRPLAIAPLGMGPALVPWHEEEAGRDPLYSATRDSRGHSPGRAQLIGVASRFSGHYSCYRGAGPLPSCARPSPPRPADSKANAFINNFVSMIVRNENSQIHRKAFPNTKIHKNTQIIYPAYPVDQKVLCLHFHQRIYLSVM